MPFYLIIAALVLSTSSACTSKVISAPVTPAGAEAAAPAAAPAATAAMEAKTTTAGSLVASATAVPASTAAGPLATIPAPANTKAPGIASYAIQVTLDPEGRDLTGSEVLTYYNATQQPIPDLMLHLYLNAFKSENTIFMKESGGQLRGYPFDPKEAGWINVQSIRVQGGAPLELEILADGTLARANLPQPIAPGEALKVEIEFQSRLPRIFARTGWVLDQRGDPFFLVGQWFPKAGVWMADGWHADPFHGNAEFFADFGSYDVSITLPADYVTGATGMPGETRRNGSSQTVSYHAAGVIDFAWVASQNLTTVTDTVGVTELVYLFLPEHDWSADRTLESTALAMERFSDWAGPYPYERLTIVDVPEEGAGAGGMEYPTFITVGASDSEKNTGAVGWNDFLSVVTVHEVAHQWWQSMIATDEGREPWLDEGFADYATLRLFVEKFGLKYSDENRTAFPQGFLQGRRNSFLRNPDVPMEGTAWGYGNFGDYVIAAYAKPDMALLTLENVIGKDTMTAILRTYYARYRFAHPTTADFQKVAQEVSGQSLDWFFEGLVYGDHLLNYTAKSIDNNAVVVSRGGDIPVPVDVLVTLKDGTQQTVLCQPIAPTCTFQFPQPVQTVMVDPDRKLLIDIDWADNQLPRPGAK